MTMVPYSQNGKHHHQQQNRSTNTSTNNYALYTASAMNQVVEVEGYNYNNNNCFFLGSDFVVRHMMAEEDESRANTNSTTHMEPPEQPREPEAEAGSTLKEEERGIIINNNNNNSNNWLQLSIGFHHHQGSDHHDAATTTAAAAAATKHHHDHHHHHQSGSIMAPTGSSSGSQLVELELLPGGVRHLNWGGSSSSSSSRPSLEPQAMFPLASSEIIRGSTIRSSYCQGGGGSSFGGSSSLLFEQTSMSMACGPISATAFGPHQQQQYQPQEMVNWAFGPLPHSMAIMPSPSFVSSSSSSPSQSCSSLRPPPIGSYFPTPFQFPSSGFDQFDVAGPSSHDATVRVVDPPRRPHSGIWFMLQASQNQAKEPFLPQIPKSYLRIKDGRMTVRLLLKYLVSKLRLESESEVEITCRGQQLLPFLTLQHVRDNIWTHRDTTTRTLLSDSSTTDHVMVLHYGRSTS